MKQQKFAKIGFVIFLFTIGYLVGVGISKTIGQFTTAEQQVSIKATAG